MQTIAILHVPTPDGTPTYRAIAGNKQTQGTTAGQALDALTAQLSDQPFGGTILLQSFRPDPHFTEAQQIRLTELMAAWRTARDTNYPFDETLQEELDALTLAELQATGDRCMTLLNVLAP